MRSQQFPMVVFILLLPWSVRSQEPLSEEEAVRVIERLGGKVERKDGVFVNLYHITRASDDDFAVLQSYPDLRRVDLSFTRITDRGMQHLEPLTSIKELLLEKTAISDASLRIIARLPNLEELNLRDTRVTDRGLKELMRHTSLRNLDLSSDPRRPNAMITDAGIQHLSLLSNLQEIDLCNSRVGDEGLKVS